MEIKKLNIKGSPVGLVGLDEVFQVAKQAQLGDQERLKHFLLEKIKQQNYVPSSAENDYKIALHRAYRKFLGEEVEEDEAGLVIKILGSGCPRCDQLEKDVMAALQELNLAGDIDHVRDMSEIARYGVFLTPALIINREVKSAGSVPSRSQVKEWLLEASRVLDKKVE